MRVIFGLKKGCLLKVVLGILIRLIIDKVKEFIFNMIGFYFEGGRGFDLFVGSGGFGIEVFLCGFEYCIFVDCDFKVI